MAEDHVGDVERVLADEVNADAFRADQADDLFDFIRERFLDIGEEQVRFIEEENQLGFLGVAHFGQALEEFREEPEQEGRVNFRRLLHEAVGGENIDHAAAVLRLHEVIQIQRGLAEKFVAALRFEREQAALNRAGAGSGDVAVLRFKLVRIVGHELDHRAQIFEIEQEQAALVGDAEDHIQHAFLRVV